MEKIYITNILMKMMNIVGLIEYNYKYDDNK